MANLYAEKIFAEHPIAIWSLDDDLTFTSLITTAKNLNNWTFSGGTAAVIAASDPEYRTPPILTSTINLVKAAGATSITFTCNQTVLANTDFTIAFYYFCENPYATSIDIAYNGVTKNFLIEKTNSWNFISQNFTGASSAIAPTVKVNYISGKEADVLINGLSVGNRSEEFNKISTGVSSFSQSFLPFTNNILAANSYLANGKQGYYVAQTSEKIAAKNSSVPLVFGSNNCTVLYANTDSGSNPIPSFVIPGFGMLNNSGRHKTLTLEFWTRINAQTSQARRIVGPISSTDGLYIDGSFLRLKIGSNIESAYIQEWARPILIQLSISDGMAILTVNGEEMIRLLYQTSTLSFPDKQDNSGKQQDWIGFYSYSDIQSFEIDCVSIYSYLVPNVVSKKHLVYGQATKYPNDIVASHNGSATVLDYSYAKYNMNYNYPENGKWQHGFFDGLSFDNNVMSVPSYSLPTFSSSNGSINLITDMATLSGTNNPSFINLKPGSAWNDVESYMVFSQLSLGGQKIRSMWMNITTGSSNPTADQILFKIENTSNNDYFKAVWSASDKKIRYSYLVNGLSGTYYTSAIKNTSTNTCVGLDFDVVSASSQDLNSFFQFTNQLRIYVGGDSSYVTGTTFAGNIYSVAFSSVENFAYFSQSYDTNGIVKSSVSSMSTSVKYATYTLLPQIFLGTYILDIATSAYWQDSIPLSFLGKTTTNNDGVSTTLLDYVQYNVNYPQPIFTTSGTYNTSGNILKMYSIFQQNSDISTVKGSSISSIVHPTSSNIVGGEALDSTKMYEIVDNVLIKPPTNFDASTIRMNLYFEFNTSAVLQNKIRVMSVQLASQISSATAQIGTKFGTPISSVTSNATNPILVSKDTTPHLWLSSKSGIALAGDTTSNSLSISLNRGQADVFQIAAMQFFARWNYESFPDTTEFINISTASSSSWSFSLFLTALASDPTRAIVTSDNPDVSFFLNGNPVGTLVVNIREWAAIGIAFKVPINLNSNSANIVMKSKMNFENITYYLQNEFEVGQQWGYRQWYSIKYGDSGLGTGSTRDPLSWSSVASTYTKDTTSPNGLKGGWMSAEINNVSQNTGIYPADVYNAFVGTNAITFDSEVISAGTIKLRARNAEYRLVIDTVPTLSVYTPV
jgi:hypothetical protein